MPTATPDPTALLRAANLRVTSPRLMTLEALAAHPHASADELALTVRERLGTVSTQAIYDVLRACGAAGIVRRFEPAGSRALYELNDGANHHHLVCRRCGAIDDVECAVGSAPCLEPADDRGYEIDEAEVVYWGVCAACISTARAHPPENTPTDQSPTKE